MDSGRASVGLGAGQSGLVAVLAVLGLGLGSACAPEGGGGTGMEIRVTPLQFEPVLNVCYDIEVFDSIGTSLWRAGNPELHWDEGDLTTICASDYGTGSGGDIQYIGDCDPTFNPNVVAITIDGIYTMNGRLRDGIDWLPTCTAAEPCYQYVECQPDANVLVDFNILVMRSANQGFFDIAVTFDDVFCSAKVDCTYDAEGNEPIMAVNFDGTDLQTAVVGLACTAGPDTPEAQVESVLLMNDIRIQCSPPEDFQASLQIYSCEDDSNTFYGVAVGSDGGAPSLSGFVAMRNGSSYDVVPFAVAGMPSPYTIAVMQRILTDTTAPREGIVLLAEPSVGPGSQGLMSGASVALATNDGSGWTLTSVADNAGESIVAARATDGSYVIATNSFEGLNAGGRVLAYPLVGSPGARGLDSPLVFEVPVGLVDCEDWQTRDGFVVASCREGGIGPDGNLYDTFRGVLLVLDLGNPGSTQVLVPDANGFEMRVSELDFAGLIRDGGDLVIAVNARFQWSAATPYDNDDWNYDATRYAVVWRCAHAELGSCESGDPAVPAPEYRKHTALTPSGRETESVGIADQFLFGSFALEIEGNSPEGLSAVFEAGGPEGWKRWYDFRDPKSKPAENVVIHGMFPKSRVIYGSYGPFVPSAFAGYPPYQATYFIAFIPEADGESVNLINISAGGLLEFRGTLGRIGPDSAGRLMVLATGPGEDPSVAIDMVGVYSFAPDFLSALSLDWFAASSLLDADPALHERWNPQSFDGQYTRSGMLESRTFDLMSPNCPQVFGEVMLPDGHQASLIIDPDLDQFLVYPPGDPGAYVQTSTLSLASPLGLPSWLHTGDSYVVIDPTTSEGYYWHQGDVVMNVPPNPRPADVPRVLQNYAVYRGVEELNCGSRSCNKLYWNVAIGFDPSLWNCTLYADTTAASAASVAGDGALPERAYWPWLEATVPLTGPQGGLICRQHPMGSDAYPASAHAMRADNQACHRYDGGAVLTAPWCQGFEYWLRYREWNP